MNIERELLGCIILDDDRLVEIKHLINPEDFKEPYERKVYETMLSMRGEGLKIDEVTLGSKLAGVFVDKDSSKIKGMVMELMAISGCSADAGHYAKLVLQNSINARIGKIFNETTQKINSGSIEEVDMNEVRDEIERIRNQSLCQETKSLRDIIKVDDDTNCVPVSIGFNGLDSAHSGGLMGELTILAGSPSTGKSQLAVNLMLNATKNGEPARSLFICQEMSAKEVQDRIVGSMTGVHFNAVKAIRRGEAPESTFERYYKRYNQAIEKLAVLPMKIHTTGALTFPELEAIITRHIKEVDIIVVDYLQQIRKIDGRMSDYEKTNQVSAFCMGMAVKHGVPIIGLSQFNRDGYKDNAKKPTIANLRESGQLEQDAANVWLLWRDMKDQGDIVKLELEIAKNRNGQIGTVTFDYAKSCGRMVECNKYQNGGFEG